MGADPAWTIARFQYSFLHAVEQSRARTTRLFEQQVSEGRAGADRRREVERAFLRTGVRVKPVSQPDSGPGAKPCTRAAKGCEADESASGAVGVALDSWV